VGGDVLDDGGVEFGDSGAQRLRVSVWIGSAVAAADAQVPPLGKVDPT
jgi:hypothetical protein